MPSKLSFGSFCVHEAEEVRNTKPHVLPIYATSSFVFEDIEEGMDIFSGKRTGHVYGRYGNPTIDTMQNKLAALEVFGSDLKASGVLCSSGMSAISTLILACLKAGDKVLTQGNIYGGTTELFIKILAKFSIEPIFVDLNNETEIEEAIKAKPSIKMIYFETPANPTLACVDVKSIAELGKKHNVLTVADNTFCTPYLQQPLLMGVDFVVHSTTKFLNGHGNGLAGIIISTDLDFMKAKVWQAMKLLGTNCNPFDAWLINNGLKTLELRMDRHCSNAMAIATFLEAHPAVAKVNYPGLKSHPHHSIAKKQMRQFGALMSFELKGGFDAGVKFMNKVKLCVLAPTLGDVDTLVLHPASSSHINIPKELREKNGITDGMIRLSVGIENEADLIADLQQAIA